MILSSPYDALLKKLFSGGLKARSFLLTGDKESRERAEEILVKLLKCEKKILCKNCAGCKSESDLDLHRYQEALLKMESAKEIEREAHKTSWQGAKIFLMKSEFIGPEAQAALLKTVEEPPADSYFIISVSSAGALLAPLLSRLTLFELGRKKTSSDAELLKKLGAGGAGKQVLRAATLAKDRSRLEETLQALEFWTEERIKKAKAPELKKTAGFLEDLLAVKTRFYAKTYFNRMLLEHLIISRQYLNP